MSTTAAIGAPGTRAPAPRMTGSPDRCLADLPLDGRSWRGWWLALAAALALAGVLAFSIGFLFLDGTAIWGNNIPITWSLDIVGYDWWIGVACGSLMVGGVLVLLDVAECRVLARIAQATALLAALAAAVYPIIHLGRPWFFYWNLPYPDSFGLWPQFRSPLVWDAFDILAFLGLSSGLFYFGVLPDLAGLRDRAWARARSGEGGQGVLRAQLYGIAALGWRGSVVHWHRWVQLYRCLAGLGLLTVVTLQVGASVMFAGTLEPGWHDTLLPVTYLSGAGLAGTGMLCVLTIVLRHAFGLHAAIGARQFRLLAGLLLGFAALRLYCEAASDLTVMLGSDAYARAARWRATTGPVAWGFWMLVTAGLLPPLLLAAPRLRVSPRALAWIGGAAAAGIWADHLSLITATLQHDFLPSAAHGLRITLFEWATFVGSAGIFLLLLLLALRFVPILADADARLGAAPRSGSDAAGMVPSARETARHAPLWGAAGEFATGTDMVQAIRALRSGVGLRVDAYAPAPSAAAASALGLAGRAVAWFAALGFGAGSVGTFALCAYATGVDYVFEIGGRPSFSWPAYVVPASAAGCLGGGVAAVAAMLVLNRLPRLNHPAFNIPGIGRATRDRYFVAAHGHEAAIDPAQAEAVLRGLPALSVHLVSR